MYTLKIFKLSTAIFQKKMSIPSRFFIYMCILVLIFISIQLKLFENYVKDYRPLNSNEDRQKLDKVKEMFQHAWDNYVKYAWGDDELRPISKTGISAAFFGHKSIGASIIDGLDTLYIMGFKNEFNQARKWIDENFKNINSSISAFEANIRLVGGLLSVYSLTGDVMFQEKAVQIANMLLPVFDTPTGIPLAIINTASGECSNYKWTPNGCSILSEFGSYHLEFAYLSDVTGDPKYKEKVDRIRTVLEPIQKPKGLYPNFLNPYSGTWGSFEVSVGAFGDSFYEYLLKSWLQSGSTDHKQRQIIDEALQAIRTHLIQTSNTGLIYLANMNFDKLEHKMEHLACFAGGLFGLAARSFNSSEYMDIAEGLTNTCHESYIRSSTGLGPDTFWFSFDLEAKGRSIGDNVYILRPETVESYFILWRLTKKQKYRDWGWEVVQSLEKYCRVECGYSGIRDVYSDNPQKDDLQQSFFLAETLKYLYLLFSDDRLLSLDEWVFNTEAHPLPIKGANTLYRVANIMSEYGKK